MRICAIVLNYFGDHDTIPCVESLLTQEPPPEVFIVENSGSPTQATRLTLAFHAQERVHLLCTSRNLGYAGGVNFALDIIGLDAFEAFLVVNNDTLMPPDNLSKLVRGSEKLGFDITAPLIYHYPDCRKIWSRGCHYNRFTGFITQRPLCFLPGDLFYLTGCCLLIRSVVLCSMGRFDTAFFMYGEDVEFCYRASRSGFRYGVVSDSSIYHKVNAASEGNSSFYEYHMNRAHLLLAEKLTLTAAEAKVSFALKAFMLLGRAIWRSLRLRNGNAFRGLRLAFSERSRQ